MEGGRNNLKNKNKEGKKCQICIEKKKVTTFWWGAQFFFTRRHRQLVLTSTK